MGRFFYRLLYYVPIPADGVDSGLQGSYFKWNRFTALSCRIICAIFKASFSEK